MVIQGYRLTEREKKVPRQKGRQRVRERKSGWWPDQARKLSTGGALCLTQWPRLQDGMSFSTCSYDISPALAKLILSESLLLRQLALSPLHFPDKSYISHERVGLSSLYPFTLQGPLAKGQRSQRAGLERFPAGLSAGPSFNAVSTLLGQPSAIMKQFNKETIIGLVEVSAKNRVLKGPFLGWGKLVSS